MSVDVEGVEVRPDLAIERYYRWHAPIYDLTRWSFLFGRSELLRWVASTGLAPERIVEVGCGTGRNLALLARRFPFARLTGVDLSTEMLDRAVRRLRHAGARTDWIRGRYGGPQPAARRCDLLLFSYSLTMMNPGWEAALRAAVQDLRSGGRIAVVDFAGTRWGWFRRWMAGNHVRLDDHLLPVLRELFPSGQGQIRSAYGGTWRYFLFLGSRA